MNKRKIFTNKDILHAYLPNIDDNINTSIIIIMPYHKATNFTSKGVRLPGLFLQLPRAQDWGGHLLCIFWGKVGGFCHDPELLSQKCHRTQWQLSRQLLPQYPTSHHWAHISSVETPLELTRCQKACSSSNNSQTVFGRSLGMKTLHRGFVPEPIFYIRYCEDLGSMEAVAISSTVWSW